MSVEREAIVASLQLVEAERRQRSGDPDLGRRVLALKAFQQHRFMRTYSDLLASERYAPAVRFFLEELYGPKDFARRDEQFAKLVSGLVKFFPLEVVRTVASVAELHALSEVLDTAMGEQLRDAEIAAADYVSAWQGVGRAADRQRQIALTLGVADTLDRFTRKPLLRKSLHLMRAPARAAGLSCSDSSRPDSTRSPPCAGRASSSRPCDRAKRLSPRRSSRPIPRTPVSAPRVCWPRCSRG